MFRQSPIFYLAEKLDDTLSQFCEQNKESKAIDHGGGGNRKSSFSSRDKINGSRAMGLRNSDNYNKNLHQHKVEIHECYSIQRKSTDEHNGQSDDSRSYSSREESPPNSISDSGENKSELQELTKDLDKMAFNSDNGGGRTHQRSRRNYYNKKYKLNYYPKLNKSYFSSLSRFPERYITERCICNAEDACTYMKLRGTSMKECHCRSHHRFLPNNIRVKVENAIIEHIIKHLLDNPVRILSLGSGAYLEDLMILLRLAERGIQCIHIAMVEPNPCSKAYPDFKYFVEKIQAIYGMKEISCSNYTDIDQVDSSQEFDVIYAIDYDMCDSQEYLREHRHVEVHNNEIPSSDPDKPTCDLIKASKYLTSEEHGLVIASKCRHILHKTPNEFPFYGMP